MNLSRAAKVTRVANAAAAAQTAVNSSSVDMQGFGACQFTVLMGSITAGAATSAKVQGSENNSDWSDLENTSQTIAADADNKAFILDVPSPRHRYLRTVVSRATQDSVVDGILAQQYLPQIMPVAHAASVGGSEVNHAPIAGTA